MTGVLTGFITDEDTKAQPAVSRFQTDHITDQQTGTILDITTAQRSSCDAPPIPSTGVVRADSRPVTTTCTMKLKGGKICGSNLTADEIGKRKRCTPCRAKAAADKRQSNSNIANGCGKRRHALQKQKPGSAKVILIQS